MAGLLHCLSTFEMIDAHRTGIIGVRLRVEQNQLVVVCWRFGSRVIELQGA